MAKWSIRPSTPGSGMVWTGRTGPASFCAGALQQISSTEIAMAPLLRIEILDLQVVEGCHAVGLRPESDFAGVLEGFIVGFEEKFALERYLKMRSLRAKLQAVPLAG